MDCDIRFGVPGTPNSVGLDIQISKREIGVAGAFQLGEPGMDGSGEWVMLRIGASLVGTLAFLA